MVLAIRTDLIRVPLTAITPSMSHCSHSPVISKSQQLSENRFFNNLDPRNRDCILERADSLHLSHQDLMQVVEYTTDFEMWDSGLLEALWDVSGVEHLSPKQRKQMVMRRLRDRWQQLKSDLPHYEPDARPLKTKGPITFSKKDSDDKILGLCPVFSDKTRCCNLQTLDAVMNCGFECTYCSIQSFYHGEEIIFQGNFREKLERIELDPNRCYHIGTGQSSDSLLWGNKNNVLQDLFSWAERHPNVILELKTKSANTHYLLDNPVPSNVICTWSMNADTIVRNEELRTAPLQSRISAARKIADRGILVGFHLHPIVAFQGWEVEYPALVSQLTDTFQSSEVALVSMGTLTFIKPVMKQLRERKQKSKILQMPFEDAAGKTSYPIELKKQFFKRVYDAFSPWHNEVFFYLCMEDPSLWPAVFGFDYANNAAFESAMKSHYLQKVNAVREHRGETAVVPTLL